ncbi:MAG TPA: hypothetical protein VLA12_13645 [Planctomycetaceae bacterium]|nr:hypothetical protein [Planctomycetaceae bacterium]
MPQRLTALILSALIISFSGFLNATLSADESNLGPVKTSEEAGATEPQAPKEADPVREKARQAVEVSKRRYLDGNLHTPWQILHGLLALRHDYEIKINGEKTSAMKWMQKGQTYAGRPWVEKTQYGGRFHTFTNPYHFEGHPNQFMAILTMSDLPTDFAFETAQGKVTIADMVEHAKMVVNTREEQTWTLWALSKYLPPNAQWINNQREPWSIERLVQMQSRANFNDSACGGTHGLFALAHARKYYLEKGEPLRGVWIEADQTIKQHINIARALQYSDGTFSCGYFAYQDYKKSFAERLGPTGHQLEFLMMAVLDEELKTEWIRKGVESVADDLLKNKAVAVDCGPLYHAVSGLVLFLERTEPPKQIIEAANDHEEPLVAPKPLSEIAIPTGTASLEGAGSE